MKILPPDASDVEILNAVREWAELLAAEQYGDAAEYLCRPSTGPDVTGELIHKLIRNYGSVEPRTDGRVMKLTSLKSARGGPTPRQAVHRSTKHPGWIHFDLPLNGEWSDLTAILWLREVEGGLGLELESLDVQ